MQALNEQFDGSLRTLLCRPQRPHVDEATLISIDKLGADVRVRVGADYSVERIGWQEVSSSPPYCFYLLLLLLTGWAHRHIMQVPFLPNKGHCWQHSEECTHPVARPALM